MVQPDSEYARGFQCVFHFLVEPVTQGGERKADALSDHAHMKKGPFDRDGIGLEEQFAVQGHEQLIKPLGFLFIAGDGGFAQRSHALGSHIGGNCNYTFGAQSHHWES